MIIRTETVRDYNAIARVNYNAFLGWHPDNPYVSEQIMVDILRHGSGFDPELSLVAEVEGRVVGHVLLYPFHCIIQGTELKGAVLGPVGVEPGLQKSGIGGKLIEEGHRRAMEKGCSFVLLCGHPEYYPRFGYRTGMFSMGGVKASLAGYQIKQSELTERPVRQTDVEWLCSLWNQWNRNSSLALFPGNTVSDWSNHSSNYRASILTAGERPLAYVRYATRSPGRVKEILASDQAGLQAALEYMSGKAVQDGHEWLHVAAPMEWVLPVQERVGLMFLEDMNVYDAFMIAILERENRILAEYCDGVASGAMKPGILIFPVMYDVDDGVH